MIWFFGWLPGHIVVLSHDQYTSHIRQALTQYQNGETQSKSDEEWARDNEANYVIQDGLLKKAWIKGKGKTAVTVWQTIVPSNMKAQIIQAFHTSTRNAHYGDLKTFTQIREHYTWNGMFSDVRASSKNRQHASRGCRSWALTVSPRGGLGTQIRGMLGRHP